MKIMRPFLFTAALCGVAFLTIVVSFGLVFLDAPLIAIYAWTRVSGCPDHADAVKRLAEGYQEEMSGRGLTLNGRLIELFQNRETGTWTLFMTDKESRACPFGLGQNWEDIKDTAPRGTAL